VRCVAIAGRKHSVQFFGQLVISDQQTMPFGLDFQLLDFVLQRRYRFALRAA
jgi:hypothetical protein